MLSQTEERNGSDDPYIQFKLGGFCGVAQLDFMTKMIYI